MRTVTLAGTTAFISILTGLLGAPAASLDPAPSPSASTYADSTTSGTPATESPTSTPSEDSRESPAPTSVEDATTNNSPDAPIPPLPTNDESSLEHADPETLIPEERSDEPTEEILETAQDESTPEAIRVHGTISADREYATLRSSAIRISPYPTAAPVRTLPAGEMVLTGTRSLRNNYGPWWRVHQGNSVGWILYSDLTWATKEANHSTVSPRTAWTNAFTYGFDVATTRGNRVYSLPAESLVSVKGQVFGAFTKVSTDGRTFWILSDRISDSAADVSYGKINPDRLYLAGTDLALRENPFPESTVLTNITDGSSVLTGSSSARVDGVGWWQVRVGETRGWVLYSELNPAPVESVRTGITYYTRKQVVLQTAPTSDAGVVANLRCAAYTKTTGERSGEYLRVRSGGHAGWVKETDLATVSRPPLLVYGTLRIGEEASHVYSGRTTSRSLDTAPDLELWLTNTAIRAGWPWALPGSSGLVGEKLRFPSSTYNNEIRRGDAWEGYVPGGDVSKMNYTRSLHCTTANDFSWVYVATPWRQQHTKQYGWKIPSGDYKRY